ncbi:MAG: hypothetical protein V4499_06230 [Pseudomonadota bacterium]
MPKKKKQETQAEQSARFKRDAKRLIDAGELNPTDAAAALDKLLRQSAGKSS